MSFKQVGPGLLVDTDKVKVSISHPNPCCVISNSEITATVATGDGSLLIFSNEKKAQYFREKELDNNYVIEEFSWDDLVDKYAEQYVQALLDHTGDPGFYQNIPLQKNI
ncbi:MAG: hypothetical protein ACKUBY_00040 [Candidatus Moraniibacteriota bacterium]|jgi:hypothetical protein